MAHSIHSVMFDLDHASEEDKWSFSYLLTELMINIRLTAKNSILGLYKKEDAKRALRTELPFLQIKSDYDRMVKYLDALEKDSEEQEESSTNLTPEEQYRLARQQLGLDG